MKKTLLFLLLLTLFLIVSCGESQKGESTANSQKEDSNTKNTLSIEAALVYKSGDVKPVARTEFFLLDKDFKTILEESKFTSDLRKELKVPLDKIPPIRVFSLIVEKLDGTDISDTSDEMLEKRIKLEQAIKKPITATRPHIQYEAITDFQGKATFENLKSGEYYLFGYSKAGNSVVIWDLKTVVKDGQNSVILDQKNALN